MSINDRSRKRFHIAVLAGDGIGPEVTAETKKVIAAAATRDDATFEWNHLGGLVELGRDLLNIMFMLEVMC